MERKDRPVKDDDVPIIGDFSADADARLAAARRASAARADAAPAARRGATRMATAPQPGVAGSASTEQWRLDPGEVRRHARRIRERERSGPLARIVRAVLVFGVLAALGAAYFNFDALRSAVLELPFVARWLGDRSAPGAVTAPPLPDESETVVVEPPRVVGVAEPTDEDGEPVNQSAAPARSAEPAVSAAAPAEQPVAAVAPEPAPPAPPPPEPPPGPETLALGSATVTVSEGAASAAVLVLRYGDTRRASSVVWSTRDGTARAGSDYVDRGAVVERFAPGEQNRRILVPIVGDRNAEGPETFYVVLTVEDDAAAGQIRETEVVITDDD